MRKGGKVRAYAQQRTFIPADAYDTLTNRQLFYCVAIFRFRAKNNRVYRSESELRAATGQPTSAKFEQEVLGPLRPFIKGAERRMDSEHGEFYWRIVLEDPTVRPDGWDRKGKWFLQVPDWWLWEHPKYHVTASGVADHWVRTEGWAPASNTLRAALSVQRADTSGLNEVRDKNTKYLANSMGKSESVASTSLRKATRLGWIGGEHLSGGNGRKAHRWTRLLETDASTTEEHVWTGAGRKPGTQESTSQRGSMADERTPLVAVEDAVGHHRGNDVGGTAPSTLDSSDPFGPGGPFAGWSRPFTAEVEEGDSGDALFHDQVLQ